MGENKKTAKNGFPLRGKVKKCWKSFVARERNAENAKNCPSLVSEMQKMGKTAFRLQATSEKHWKQHFAHKRNAENAKKRSSSVDETKKTQKIARHPWMKPRKRRKLVFGRGRRTKNGKNWLSATAEKLSSINFNAWQCILPQQKLNEMTVPGRHLTLVTPNFVFYRGLK